MADVNTQVYVTVGGSENGKDWFTEQEADHIGNLFSFLLSLTTEQRAQALYGMHERLGDKVPDYLFREANELKG